MKTEFWATIPHSSKIGEIREGRHNHIIKNVLNDPNTFISEYERNCYILYDSQGAEALLYRPHSIVGRIGSRLYLAVVSLLHKEEIVN